MKVRRVIAKCLVFSLILVGMMVVHAGAIPGPTVYLIGAGNSTDNTLVSNTLTSDGYSVTIGATYDAFSGAALSSFNAVLLMPGFPGTGSDMLAAGQSALLNYVNAGGGLVTTEWSIWLAGTGRLTTLQAAFPATSGGNYTYAPSTIYFQNVANSIIDYNLPASPITFNPLLSEDGTESALSPSGGTQVFFDSSYGGTTDNGYAGVVGWTYGSGKVISLSLLAGNTDPNFQQLLANSVTWAEGTSTVPVPDTILLLGTGLFGLAAMRRRFIK